MALDLQNMHYKVEVLFIKERSLNTPRQLRVLQLYCCKDQIPLVSWPPVHSCTTLTIGVVKIFRPAAKYLERSNVERRKRQVYGPAICVTILFLI